MAGRKIPYPWGRIRPERRIDEIEGMISKLEKQKDILALQLEDSVRKIDMNITALKGQVDVARSFAKEDEWLVLRERVYALELHDVKAMEMIYGKSISEARSIIDGLEKDRPTEPDSSAIDDSFLTSSIDEIDDIFEE